jgi:hypothetical protein
VGIAAAIVLQRFWGLSVAPLSLGFLVLATVTLLISSPGGMTLWLYVYHYVPAGGAMRVVARVALLLLIPLAVGFAMFWQWLKERTGWKYVIPLACFCLVEQGVSTPTHDKEDARRRAQKIAARVQRAGKKTQAFFHSSSRGGLPDWNDHVDAMWAGMRAGVPTVNGYSGVMPRGWEPLYDSAIRDAADEARVRGALRGWARIASLPAESITWFHEDQRLDVVPLGDRDLSAGRVPPAGSQ